ncbi:hypothetical protein DPMN_086888 [Dreissena polymorpha]|uniref:Uncharacterized protein n=1 Tax=Dreissena polymorpha TaxID=45954 RepID=A0A9D4KRZ3_DREPO|nr:hypothetical protein DPMN_086888 [Dreissena polymorpha]
MNLMLKTVEVFSRRHRYDINPSKSSCIRVNPKSPDPSPDFILEGTCIPLDTSTTHIGVYRNTKCKVNTKNKIELGRCTAYWLMGAGFIGKNGLKQSVKAHLWSTFVVPRMLYTLEVLPYSQADLKALEAFQLKTLKQVQHLADRTYNVAALSLLGICLFELNYTKTHLICTTV